jgi:hypothetical protein
MARGGWALTNPGAAFYTVADERFFLGVVGLVNSLRLVGHDEPVYVLDSGLADWQRELLEAESTLVPGDRDLPGNLLKGIAPRRHPADVTVLVDADIVVTRHLGELVAHAAAGRTAAFATGMERTVPEWGELLGLGELERRPYLCSALVATGGPLGAEVVEIMDANAEAVEWERTYWRRAEPGYPLLHADQDLMNAALAARAAPEQVVELAGPLLASPPFTGLRVVDAASLRCSYADGTEPYAVHHWNAKPWLERTHHGVYSQLLQRLLVGERLAVRVPPERIPRRFRRGPLAGAERAAVNAREWVRWHVAEPLAARTRGAS